MREGEPHGGWVMSLLVTAFHQALLTSEDAVLSDELNLMCAWLNIQGTQQTAVHRFRKK